MGLLRDLDRARDMPLRTIHTVGRLASSDLLLDRPVVSSCHAVIRFHKGGWIVRDLGSTNGTFVDGRRAGPGINVPLRAGARLGFGESCGSFELTVDGPPCAFATRSDGAHIIGSPTALELPGSTPSVVRCGADGRWTVDGQGERTTVRDGDPWATAAGRFIIRLPSLAAETAERRPETIRLADITARFLVSSDEEHVRLILSHPLGEIAVPPRGYQYHLLVLARARRDAPAHLPESRRGWVTSETLCRMLACTRNQLDVYVHRARQQLTAAGVEDAHAIIERHRGAGTLRFGTSRIQEIRV